MIIIKTTDGEIYEIEKTYKVLLKSIEKSKESHGFLEINPQIAINIHQIISIKNENSNEYEKKSPLMDPPIQGI